MGLIGRAGGDLLDGAGDLADGLAGLPGSGVEEAAGLGDRLGRDLDLADDTGEAVARRVVRLDRGDQPLAHGVRHAGRFADLVGAEPGDGRRRRHDPVGQVVVAQAREPLGEPGRTTIGEGGQGSLNVAHTADDGAARVEQQRDTEDQRGQEAEQDDHGAFRLCGIEREIVSHGGRIGQAGHLHEVAIDGFEGGTRWFAT